MFVYRHVASTTSSLSTARSVRVIRESANALVATGRPLSVMPSTPSAIRSMNVDAPGTAVNRAVVRERKVSGPPVRSSSTS